ncbi:MAG: hypothetical protein FWE14_04895 [Lachnospiraceae bacterium]|nr:hypothetical protein [Lachnospiraceae bacterium]
MAKNFTMMANNGAGWDTLYPRTTAAQVVTNTDRQFVSEAEKARVAGISNPNILHNWDFCNPVNQRELMEYAISGYTIDRWFMNQDSKLNIISSGISLSNLAMGYRTLTQLIDFPAQYFGKTITLSIESDGIIYTNTTTLPSSTPASVFRSTKWLDAERIRYSQIELSATSGELKVHAAIGNTAPIGTTFNISRAKLELGSISTLVNDPPVDYGKELAVCRRYQIVLNNHVRLRASFRNSSSFQFALPLETSLRINPIIIGNPDLRVFGVGTIQDGFNFTYVVSNGLLTIIANKASHGLTDATFTLYERTIIDTNL